MSPDLAAQIQLSPDRPWPLDEGLLALTGLVLNQDPVLRLRGRDEAYWEQLRAEVPSVGSAMDARRRRVTGAAMETVPGVEDDATAELYADFIRAWRLYVGQGPASGWKAVISAMWHAAAWGWRPARLSWVNVQGAGNTVRPFSFNGRSDWRVPWRVQPLLPQLYAWTAEGELVEHTLNSHGLLTQVRVIPAEVDAVSHWHVRAGAEPSPYGVGFMRYAEGPAYARRQMWIRYQSGINLAMGGFEAEPTGAALSLSGAGKGQGKADHQSQVTSLLNAMKSLDEARVLIKPPGWKLTKLESAVYSDGWLGGIAYVDKFLSMMIRGSLVSEIGGSEAPGSRAAAATLSDDLEGAVGEDDAAFLGEAIRCLDRVVLEANFGKVPEELIPLERIHAGPQTSPGDIAALAGASAAAGIEPDWEQVYTQRRIPFQVTEPLALDDRSNEQPQPIAGRVIPRSRS